MTTCESWGTWTRTKNKRIRIFRVANYTIPHHTREEPEPTRYSNLRAGSRPNATVGIRRSMTDFPRHLRYESSQPRLPS